MSLIIPVDSRLALRFIQPTHAEELTQVVVDNLDHLARWLPWATPDYDVQRCRDWIDEAVAGFGNRTQLALSIVLDGQVVGGIGWTDWQQVDHAAWQLTAATADVGYWLAADAQGQGIITRSTRVLVDYGFREAGLHRITIRAEPDNQRSCSVPERLAFRYEGTHRHAFRWNGRWVDHRVYAMLAEEWNEQPPANQ